MAGAIFGKLRRSKAFAKISLLKACLYRKEFPFNDNNMALDVRVEYWNV
jgi:hypothetical protein